LAIIPEMEGSWALPLHLEQISSFETPIHKAVFQLKQVCRHLTHWAVVVADSEYDTANFLRATAHLPCEKLLRLRPNRVLWGPPLP
jgi:hypothetical protein